MSEAAHAELVAAPTTAAPVAGVERVPESRRAATAGNLATQSAARASQGAPLEGWRAGSLHVAPPDDPREREAESVANVVAPHAAGVGEIRAAVAAHFRESPLPARLHSDDESRARASAVGARAFTRGADVFLGRGAASPETDEGARLLAHELVHIHQRPAADLLLRSPDTDEGLTGFTAAKPGMDPRIYISRYSANIAVLLNVLMSRLEVATGSRYAQWRSGNATGFDAAVWNFSELDVYPELAELLEPERPESIVNRGRPYLSETDPRGNEWRSMSDEWADAVGLELKNALVPHVVDSLQRVMPKYVAFVYERWRKEGMKFDPAALPQPIAERLLPAHPMDRRTIHALAGNALVSVDYMRMASDRVQIDPRYEPGEERTAVFEFLAPEGAWFWVRVLSPRDPTREEVADALFGDPAKAWRVVDAAPLFGFTGVADLVPGYLHQLEAHALDPATPPSPLGPAVKERVGAGGEPWEPDPIAELAKGPLADSAALNQAAKLPQPKDTKRATVLEDMRISFELLDAMAADGKRFHDHGELAAARDKVAAKRTELATMADVEVARWAGQAAEQRRVLAGASTGLAEAVAQLDHYMAAGELRNAHELAEYILEPLLNLGESYIRAGALSFFVGSGAAALVAAEQRSRTFSIDLMEGILRAAEANLQTISNSGAEREAAYGVAKLRERLLALRQRLAETREELLRDPDSIALALDTIYAEVADIQTEVAIAANLDAIDSAEQILDDSESLASDLFFQEYEIRDNYIELVRGWRVLWREVYDSWQKGDHDKAKERFRVLVTSPRYKEMFQQVSAYADTAAKLNLVARLLALVVITFVTMGLGTYATAFAATAWGGAAAAAGELTTGAAVAGFLAGTVVEATSFTILNALLVEPDVTWRGFLADFGFNLLLFGLLRKASMMYRAAEWVKAATIAGKTIRVAAGEMAMQWAIMNVATIAREEISRRLQNKKSLSKEEIGMILLQSAAMFIGMAVAQRAAEPLMKEIAASASTLGARMRLVNAQRARLAEIGRLVATTGDADAARDLIVQDRAELQSEIDFYKEVLLQPAELAKSGYTAEQIASLQKTGQQQIAELDAAQSLFTARRAGGNTYEALREEVPGILDAHRKAGFQVTPIRTDENGEPETWLMTPPKGPEIRVTVRPPDPVEIELGRLRARLSPEGQEAFDRLLDHELSPHDALAKFRKMPPHTRDFEREVLSAAKKLPVATTVPGLYAGVRLDTQQGPWTFTTSRVETKDPDGTIQITLTTVVTLKAPNGKVYGGDAMRTVTLHPLPGGGYRVELTMDMAFLDEIPRELRWVKEGAVPLIRDKGTPLQTYVTLMQLREAGVQLGQVTEAHLSTIVNKRTCCELASFRKRYAPGAPVDAIPSKFIERTQSGTYAMTNLVQAGVRVRGMRIQGGSETTIGDYIRGSEMDDDAVLAELGLSRKEKMLKGFDIIIDIEPPAMPPAGTGKTTP